MSTNNQLEFGFPKGGAFVIALVVLAVIFFSKATVTIGSGEAGVLYKSFVQNTCFSRTDGYGCF